MLEIRRACVSYHVGVTIFIVGFVLFLVGFSCPFWTNVADPPEMKIGLWLSCSAHRQCRAISSISFVFGGWWSAVQVFQCVSLVFWAVATGICVMCGLGVKPVCPDQDTVSPSDLCRRHPRHRQLLMASAALAGICGILGDVVFVAKLTTSHDVSDSVDLSWAFAVNLTGCCFAVVASAIFLAAPGHPQPLSVNRTSHDPAPYFAAVVACDGDDGTMNSSPAITEPEVTCPPFRIVVPEELPRYMWSRDEISTRF